MVSGSDAALLDTSNVFLVGDGIAAGAGEWTFSGAMCEKFEEHVSKSVPFYVEGHGLVERLSEFFIGNDSLCYEIGSSAGTLISALAKKYANREARFHGLEVEQDMVEVAKNKYGHLTNIDFTVADACFFEFESADMLISYYTLQFVPPKRRQMLVDKIYKSLNWGGAFVLFEKVRGPDARFQDILTQCYIDFKLDQGYSSEEIVSKSRSLRRVLEPFTTSANVDMMRRAGFSDVTTIMKYGSFEGFLAIK